MAIFLNQPTLVDLIDNSILSIEGTILAVLKGYIPGVQPRQLGFQHILKEVKIIEANHIGRSIRQEFNEISFWDYTPITVGKIIQAYLMLHQNEEGYITLMPNHSLNSVISVDSGETVRFQYEADPKLIHYGAISDPPVGFSYSAFTDMSQRNNERVASGALWENAGGPKCSYQMCTMGPCINFPIHYGTSWGSYIAPFTPGNIFQSAARTEVTIGNERPNRTSQYMMIFNRNAGYPWSSLGERAKSGEIDFQTVMSHEFGHALGLDHLPDPDDMMYPYIGVAEIKPDLSANDKDAIKSLYP